MAIVLVCWSLIIGQGAKLAIDNQRPTAATLPPCCRNLDRLRSRAGHCGHAPSLRRALRSRSLGRRRSQPQFFSHLGFQLGIDFFVVLEELARVLTALANALALVAV